MSMYYVDYNTGVNNVSVYVKIAIHVCVNMWKHCGVNNGRLSHCPLHIDFFSGNDKKETFLNFIFVTLYLYFYLERYIKQGERMNFLQNL